MNGFPLPRVIFERYIQMRRFDYSDNPTVTNEGFRREEDIRIMDNI